MKNYKVIIEYDGGYYNGLQQQKNHHKTVHCVVNNALRKVLNNSVEELNFSGRTDAGVHAFGQTFNVKTRYQADFSYGKLALGLNYYLRDEHVSAVCSQEVESNFHARYSCLQRVYKYKILNRSFKSPIYSKKAWFVPYKLEAESIHKALKFFEGTHDFSNFRNIACSAKSPIRTIDFVEIEHSNEGIIEIKIASRSFLYNMVRMIIGSIIEFARGKISLEDLKKSLHNPKTKPAYKPQLAPACGLYFLEAKYH